ncbi:MAG: kynureninase [Candidatus Tectimicrobiota bacterium]|nr:MAG: kynureninase [Candidatus Tectomicrobia bacterium]
MISRAEAEALDRADPLAPLRQRVVIANPSRLYLDGNSLGRLPVATRVRLQQVIDAEWGEGLVESWAQWIDLDKRLGDKLACHFLGAAAGEVLVSDSTTVNLYKLVGAAVASGKTVLVTDGDNFPTDRYVLQGWAQQLGVTLNVFASHPVYGPQAAEVATALRHVPHGTALVCLSHVSYRSGALADMAAINAVVHQAGGWVLWDLCHAVGAVPIALHATGTELAVGCTYKYLNGGPGAPAFLYVRRDLQETLRSPIWGWFGQRDQFAFGAQYQPAPGVQRFATGTPPVVAMAAIEPGLDLLLEAGLERLRHKSIALTALLIALYDAWLAPYGFTLGTPREPQRRGSHVALRHPEAYRISRALLRAGVVVDFREPDTLRCGLAPLYTRFVDVWEAMDRLRTLMATQAYTAFSPTRARVT